MYVEDVQENADARGSAFAGNDRNHFAIGRRKGYRASREQTLGIAKEPGAERGQNEKGNGIARIQNSRNQNSGQYKSQSVVDAVSNHARCYFTGCLTGEAVVSPRRIE